mmetsp:Transcript_84226/g.272229  ORF Transcript_84226/g.272229 Transcript_84226/m.272229 type:complete len:250 (+) Transcript_84226:907-1656(+)
MFGSSGSPYLWRAMECLNWRYSQSWTCSVTALMPEALVLAWDTISGKALKCLLIKASSTFKVAQKLLECGLFAEFTILSNSFRACFLSGTLSLAGRRQRNAGDAPVPTSHCVSKSISFGYARSMQTVNIFAHVSPQPSASCTMVEMQASFSSAVFDLSFIIGYAFSATSINPSVRCVTLLTRFSSSSLRTRGGMMRKQLVIRGLPVFFRYATMAFSMVPPGANAFKGSCQNCFVFMRGACTVSNKSRLQ